MKGSWKNSIRLVSFPAVVGVAMFVAACQTHKPRYVDVPGLPAAAGGSADAFQAGDQVTITFSPPDLAAPCRVTVKEDGSITVPLLGSLIAAGKTPEALRREILERHGKRLGMQPHYAQRYFYVTGEVNRPGPSPYHGATDIVRAVSAAGDLTDSARKAKIQITRANGRTETINYQKAIEDPRHSVPVFPGDTIHVPRRRL